jgi:hypothetical protein
MWKLAPVLATALGLCCSPPTGAAGGRVLHVRDEGRLAFVRGRGQRLIDEGPVSGTLAGRGRAYFAYDGNPEISAEFTIWDSGWSLYGHGSGRLNDPNATTPSFRGRIAITGGGGRFAHVSGSGELFGVFSRRNYSLIVQTITVLRY